MDFHGIMKDRFVDGWTGRQTRGVDRLTKRDGMMM